MFANLLNKILGNKILATKIFSTKSNEPQKKPQNQQDAKIHTQDSIKSSTKSNADFDKPALDMRGDFSVATSHTHSLRAQVFFGIAFCVSLGLMAYLYYAFLNALCVAALLCVASYFIKQWFMRFVKSNALASLFSVFVLLLLLIVPLFFVIHRGALSLLNIDWLAAQTLYQSANDNIAYILSHLPFDINLGLPNSENLLAKFSLSSIASNATNIASYIIKESINFLIDICFIMVFLFVFFYYGGRIYKYLERILPFGRGQVALVAGEINGVLRVVFFSTILNVCLQGVAFGVCAWAFGLDGVLLGVLYGICSLIPIIGGILVWLPTALVLYAQGQAYHAVFLALYSLVFIAFIIDSVVKPFLIRVVNKRLLDKPLEVNEFIIFFAIFAGLGAFGFWGIIFGPAISVFFIALLRIYEKDFV
ncbi:AI-2E family transporter [Helicobacter sp. T3_23-1056]